MPAIGSLGDVEKRAGKLIKTRAIAVSDPSSPARGTSVLIHPLNGAQHQLEDPGRQQHGDAQEPRMPGGHLRLESSARCRGETPAR